MPRCQVLSCLEATSQLFHFSSLFPLIEFIQTQSLQKEIEGHQPRVDEVLQRGQRMTVAAEGSPEAEHMSEEMNRLKEVWARLQDEMAKRRVRLNASNDAQQYYNDADEAEAWIGEQELYMIADDKVKVKVFRKKWGINAWTTLLKFTQKSLPFFKLLLAICWIYLKPSTLTNRFPLLGSYNLHSLQDEQSAMILLKRHLVLKQVVDDYADSIQQLADHAQKMFAEEHPEGYAGFTIQL